MSGTPPITGGCLCGAVRFEIDTAPIATRACWCRLCQYLGAGSGTVNAIFPSAAFRVTGETKAHVATADSGTVMRRHFCPECGSQVHGFADTRPHLVTVRVGSLDDPEVGAPQSTIWTAAAPTWASIDEALPKLAGQPAPPPPPA
ncbi:GFA family protein [Sphingomonas profundi]|uniref:GFA family protein n=1 Tax=Alterirhizorhabdus profundi TaxID=2681549 RepID=UPI0012E80431|nr:GFA family protein [Sphingomonas profundi]